MKETVRRSKLNKRIFYAILFLVLLLIEIFIAVYINDTLIRPYLGDVLVVIVMYSFIRIWIPEGIDDLPCYLFLLATGLEILQYFNIVTVLGWESNRLARIVLGMTFDLQDILCYGVGTAILLIVQWFRTTWQKR